MSRLRNTRPRHLATALLLAAGLGLSGCGYDPTYYQLTPWPGSAQAGGPAPVEVRSVSFPTALDRDQIVTRAGYALKLDKHAAWGEAPGTQIGQVLVADLAQRLPGAGVTLQGSATANGGAAAFVELDVTAFSGDGQGHAVLTGSLSVHGAGDGPFASTPVNVSVPAGDDTAGLVAALSQAVGQLADQAAGQVRALPPVAAVPAAAPEPVSPVQALAAPHV